MVLAYFIVGVVGFLVVGFAATIPASIILHNYVTHPDYKCTVLGTEIISDPNNNYLMGNLSYVNYNKELEIIDYVSLSQGDLDKLLVHQKNKYAQGVKVLCNVKASKGRIKAINKFKADVIEWLWIPFGIIFGLVFVGHYLNYVCSKLKPEKLSPKPPTTYDTVNDL